MTCCQLSAMQQGEAAYEKLRQVQEPVYQKQLQDAFYQKLIKKGASKDFFQNIMYDAIVTKNMRLLRWVVANGGQDPEHRARKYADANYEIPGGGGLNCQELQEIFAILSQIKRPDAP